MGVRPKQEIVSLFGHGRCFNLPEHRPSHAAMNAYLFTGVTTRSQVRPIPGSHGVGDTIQTWDACATQIVLGDSPEEAQAQFETWLRATPEGENPVKVTVRKIAAAQFVDQWFTESGGAPLNWPEILKRAESQLQSTPDG